MGATRLDMQHYARKAHFDYFRAMAYPYAGITINVDITELLRRIKAKGYPFFLTFLHCAVNAANSVPELRQRIEGEGIVEYSSCESSHTVVKADGTYGYCRLDCTMALAEFLPYAKAKQEQAKHEGDLDEGGDPLSLLYVSSTPWFSFTALVQPTPSPADSNPRIIWGKYFEQGERTLIPLSILCNHALADGLHIAAFFDALNERIGNID